MNITIYCDGGCRNNGGRNASAYGSFAVIHNNDIKRVERKQYPWLSTNNQAEFQTMLEVFKYIDCMTGAWTKTGGKPSIEIFTDSALLVGTLNGWKVKSPNLVDLRNQLIKKCKELKSAASITIKHTPRDNIVKVLGH